MTMTTAQISALTRLLLADRDDWDGQGVLKHVELLAARPESFAVLQVQAITRAGNFGNKTPKCILDPIVAEQPASLPVVPYNPCPEHPKSGLRLNGECAGCWVDAADDTAPFVRAGVTAQAGDRAEELRRLAFPQRFELARKQREDEGKAVTNGK